MVQRSDGSLPAGKDHRAFGIYCMETTQQLTREALRDKEDGTDVARPKGKVVDEAFDFRKARLGVRNAGRKFRNFASAIGCETYNAGREGELLSRWKGLPPARTSARLILSPAVASRARLRKGVLDSGDCAVPVGRDPELGIAAEWVVVNGLGSRFARPGDNNP